jgi:hypothetical protein
MYIASIPTKNPPEEATMLCDLTNKLIATSTTITATT